MRTKKIVLSGLLISIGTLASHIVVIPAGVAKCYPLQHAINVISAILLGPCYAVANAFLISLLRNMLGVGSILAFPGSIFGAMFAGIAYTYLGKSYAASIGEVIGTGIIGSLAAFPLSKFLLGSEIGVLFFIPPFIISSIGGSVIGLFIVKSLGNHKKE
ncbi:MAG: energy coupling factor transporter S component ThiW [Senegalia sp. (in: firmicutes)]|uniref:energy coupling factor transporter S component ThiW n=1 Tax=Senegalia sp. (in: firmicutes) TaxID=1924098 RepID=UPI003F9A7502